MTAEDEAWLAYFYPKTVNALGYGVLRNNLDIQVFEALQVAEYELVGERFRQLLEGSVRIPLKPDVSYLQDVHRHLFQDVYPWAGEFRTVNMRKEDSVFANKDLLGSYLRPLMRTVVTTSWDHLDHKDFVFLSSFTFAGLNHGHPFREGNGRTTKAVLHEISKLSKFELDFDQVGAEEWNAMAKASIPGPGEIMPRHEAAMNVFTRVAVPRTTPVPDLRAQAAEEISQRIYKGTQQEPSVTHGPRAGYSSDASDGLSNKQTRQASSQPGPMTEREARILAQGKAAGLLSGTGPLTARDSKTLSESSVKPLTRKQVQERQAEKSSEIRSRSSGRSDYRPHGQERED